MPISFGSAAAASQSQSLKQLGDLQRGLGLETESLAEKLAPAKVYALSLRGAARQMQKAAEQIGRKEVGSPTQTLQLAARQRFVDMVGGSSRSTANTVRCGNA